MDSLKWAGHDPMASTRTLDPAGPLRITFYNRTRRHSHLGGVSPEQFEAAHKVRRRGVH